MRPNLPIVTPDNHNLKGIKNLYLGTEIGPLNVLGFVEGVGDFAAVLAASVEMDLDEWGKCRVLSLDGLLSAKRAAGREKDKPTIMELERIQKLLQDKPPSGPS